MHVFAVEKRIEKVQRHQGARGRGVMLAHGGPGFDSHFAQTRDC